MQDLDDILPVVLAAGERGELPDLLPPAPQRRVPQTPPVAGRLMEEARNVREGIAKWSGRF
jgi:hypothetical protein